MDEGPIVAQSSVAISYPIKIDQALELQSGLIVDLAADICRDWRRGSPLTARKQDHSRATYSIWRDDADYNIDWAKPAADIARFVDAVGYPYSGARSTVEGEAFIVENATVVDDLQFEHRHIGKVWRLDNGRPVVVCASGLLRLDDCRTANGNRYEFRRVRVRLGSERTSHALSDK